MIRAKRSSSPARFQAGSTNNRRALFPSTDRSAFTLVECLVALAIISLLLSLLLPAIGSARESARRMECLSNVKQLMLACDSHASTYGHYPRTVKGASGTPQAGPIVLSDISAQVYLLPYLDQKALFERIGIPDDGLDEGDGAPGSQKNPDAVTQQVALFLCPSDDGHSGSVSYRVNLGAGPGIEGLPTIGPFTPFGAIRPRDVVDGLSSTVFFSERLLGDRNPKSYATARDYFFSGGDIRFASDAERLCRLAIGTLPDHQSYVGSAWLYSGYKHTWYNHVRTPNSRELDCMNAPGGQGALTARSAHPGGVNIALGDGSARFINDAIDLSVWKALGTRRGGESASLP
jgi:prepilin-type N-terminal cleavage/methylation domain-containing protein/prepilin-type processing-associated H-X9-DG protein